MRWKDKDTLYLLGNNENTSTIYSYNVESNEIKIIKKVDRILDNLIVKGDTFIVTERVENEVNRNIYMTSDWHTYKLIDKGFSIKFLSQDLIAYLKKNEKNDSNFLYIYDLKDEQIASTIEGNISNYDIIDEDSLIYVNQNTNNADYTIIKYRVRDSEAEEITTIIGDKIFYDEKSNIIYLNILLPFEDNKTEMIYSIDVNKLKGN